MSLTLIHNAQLVLSDRVLPGYLIIDRDRIADVGWGEIGDVPLRVDEAVDARGALLMPGLVDCHVHFREPGMTRKGTIASESRAALAGGITTVIDMPNTVPATTTVGLWRQKEALGRSQSAVDYHAFIGATDGIVRDLEANPNAMIPGVKLFLGATTGSMKMPSPTELEELFKLCAKRRIPLMVHAEDNEIIARNTAEAVRRFGCPEAVPVEWHSIIRSSDACLEASRKIIDMALTFGTRLHLAHVTTAAELSLLSTGPVQKKLITAETTPLYLEPRVAAGQCLPNRIKVNPAVKAPHDCRALLQAVRDGRIDTIGTDHAPHLLYEKQGGALTAASGAPHAQFALPLLLENLEPQVVARAAAANPAYIFGFNDRGAIRPGLRADLVLVEQTEPYTISDNDVLSPCGWTPYSGLTVRHRVARVWQAGR